MSEDKVEVKLTIPVRDVDDVGKRVTCDKVVLYAPTRDDFDEILDIKCIYFAGEENSMAKLAPAFAGKSSDELDPAEIAKKAERAEAVRKTIKKKPIDEARVLYTSKSSIKEAMNAFVRLFEAGRGKLDDKYVINSTLWREISAKDQDIIMGTYLINFIIAS